jgi:hypothetical protein
MLQSALPTHQIKTMRTRLFAIALASTLSLPAAAQTPAPATTDRDKAALPTITDRTDGLQRLDGFVPLFWDERGGRLLLEIGAFDRELLYVVSLPAGLGSNPVGLDRGQLGDTYVVTFQRVGPRVLMTQPNYRFRAITDDPAERRAVADSFARSVLWGFKVEAETGGRVLVDATDFFLRDAHGVAGRLRQTNQGTYRVDASRSAFHLPRTKAFPKNTEVETVITLVTDAQPGPLVSQVTPTPEAVTVRQHHSFVELPDMATNPYRPRKADPRVGSIDLTFHDYASPITDPIEKHWVVRHHLQKQDPAAAVSDAVAPIVYYVDNGTPEPIRSALLDGARWWSAAFEAAGFRNAYRVEVLPEDADPMDLRYNMIHWVHRSTRGWSYGASVVDPRTGQILKGNVSLGSLRVRQDVMLASGLTSPFGADDNLGQWHCDAGMALDAEYLAQLAPGADPAAMALARIRQLSAHEVGHTLGFSHNFAASTYGRASVMDYPAPLVKIVDGTLDLSDAYGVGIGPFDTFAVRYAYGHLPPGTDEDAALARLVEEGVKAGMLYVSDADARPAGAAHPLGHLWDNGADPVTALAHELEVRRIGMTTFGLSSIRDGMSLSHLEQTFLPLYFHHRYQVQATVKSLGGVHYTYAVRSGTTTLPEPPRIVAPDVQRAALAGLLRTLSPEVLVVPERILALLQPRAEVFGGFNTELFPRRTGLTFDPVGVATIAADLTISALLNAERAARLVEFHARDTRNPGLHEVLDGLDAAVRPAAATARALDGAIVRSLQALYARRLMDLAANATASSDVRALASHRLTGLKRIVGGSAIVAQDDAAWQAHWATLEADIDRFLSRPEATVTPPRPLPTPAGDPIG